MFYTDTWNSFRIWKTRAGKKKSAVGVKNGENAIGATYRQKCVVTIFDVVDNTLLRGYEVYVKIR